MGSEASKQSVAADQRGLKEDEVMISGPEGENHSGTLSPVTTTDFSPLLGDLIGCLDDRLGEDQGNRPPLPTIPTMGVGHRRRRRPQVNYCYTDADDILNRRGCPPRRQSMVDWIMAHKRKPFSCRFASGRRRSKLPKPDRQQAQGPDVNTVEADEFREAVEGAIAACRKGSRLVLDAKGYNINKSTDDEGEKKLQRDTKRDDAVLLSLYGDEPRVGEPIMVSPYAQEESDFYCAFMRINCLPTRPMAGADETAGDH